MSVPPTPLSFEELRDTHAKDWENTHVQPEADHLRTATEQCTTLREIAIVYVAAGQFATVDEVLTLLREERLGYV